MEVSGAESASINPRIGASQNCADFPWINRSIWVLCFDQLDGLLLVILFHRI